MKKNYKRLGDFVRLADVRNKDLKVKTLLGLTINKGFIPSVANTVGTNMANYKIIRKNQFACSLMQVRRDKKIPIALLKDFDEAIISQAYPVFEIVDTEKLLPEYLMMWFSRSEFDREACFYAVGGVRGSLDWEDFLEMGLPVPSIERQREIVAEYNVIVNKIKLNERLNKKLEETAQAIYKRWFVEFEFPNEEGKPYKSSGGKMVWNEELEKDIPEGWRVTTLYDMATFINGSSFKNEDFSINKLGLPIVKIAELKEGIGEQTSFTTKDISDKFKIYNHTLLYSWSGNPNTSLEVFKWLRGNAILNQHIFKLDFNDNQSNKFVYYLLKELKHVLIKLATEKQTTGLGHVTVADMKLLRFPFSDRKDLNKFDIIINPFYENDSNLKIEIIKLEEIKLFLLSKMAKG